jgi:hypothetical protein
MNDSSEAEFEVVRQAGGWGVRRVGEPQALSHHDTREQAEEAARLHSGDGAAVDVRKDVEAEDPEQAIDAKRTFAGMGMVMVGVFVLIAVIAVVLVLTNTTT